MGYLPYDITIKSIAWIIVMGYLIILGLVFIFKYKKSPEVKFHIAVSIFFFLYAFARMFFILSDFERDLNSTSLVYYRFVAISYVCFVIAFLNIIYVFEKYITNRYAIVYIIVPMLFIDIIMIFIPDFMGIVRYINYGLLYFEIGIVGLLYLYVFKKTSGKVRKNSLISVIGLLIMSSAAILEMDYFITTGLVMPYFSPIIFAIGATIFAYGQRQIQ
jgi:hypothetical protein